jgi:hypothetical protein
MVFFRTQRLQSAAVKPPNAVHLPLIPTDLKLLFQVLINICYIFIPRDDHELIDHTV